MLGGNSRFKLKKDSIYNAIGEIDMKITVERLKEIIKEELTKAEKEKKAELEKELDTLKHK
tara:strand:+ start:872 stop:1054 length:183 start_codon:yes stop_codon:yes gene_type:complete